MSAAELIFTILIFAIAGMLLFFSIRHFLQRGALLNNAYIYASEEDRKTMDKSPLYRQCAIVFCLLSLVFIIIGLSLVLHNFVIQLIEIPVLAATIIYAIVSSNRINKQTKE